MSDHEVVIDVKSVSKSFKLPHEKHSSIKSLFVNIFRRKKSYEKQQVLDNISFQIKKGEFFGIVGRNGSGKSTLLKLLAGIYAPDKGAIRVNGKLVPFIELGVGFNMELTGRENIFLNGALLGFGRKEMIEMYDEIVKFAELEKFMDQKLKNYSSGMQVRLAFSIAIRAESDILLLDEVLAVGDANFQKKCDDYFEHIKKTSKTVILVTHSMEAVEKYCTKALLIHNGKIKNLGSPAEISKQYILDNYDPDRLSNKSDKSLSSAIKTLDVETKSPVHLSNNDNFEFSIEYVLNEQIPVYLGMAVICDGKTIMEHNSKNYDIPYEKNKKHESVYVLPLEQFNKSLLIINIAIFSKHDSQMIGYRSNVFELYVEPKTKNPTLGGPVITAGKWIVGK